MDINANPNDYKVVEFHNSTDFDFTSDLGAMYDSRPFFVKSGEKRQLPYHVGHRLATNLAKHVLLKKDEGHKPSDPPTGKPLWSDTALEELKNSYLTELYTEDKPIAQSETDRLMERVAMLEAKFKEDALESPQESPKEGETPKTSYQDKAEVIAELEVRGIKHDKRSSKADLEKLLVA